MVKKAIYFDDAVEALAEAAFDLDIGALQFKRKTANESVTSSTTFQRDDHLFGFVLDINSRYEVELVLEYDAAQGGDLKLKLATDAEGAVAAGGNGANVIALHAGATGLNEVRNGVPSGGFLHTVGGQGADEFLGCFLKGQFDSGANTSLALWWAQGTSSGTPTRIFVESYMKVTKVG